MHQLLIEAAYAYTYAGALICAALCVYVVLYLPFAGDHSD